MEDCHKRDYKSVRLCTVCTMKAGRIFDVVRRTLKRSVEAQKAVHDKQGVKLRAYEPGELVLREYPPLSQNKLGPKYQGPWVVMGMTGTHDVEICRGDSPIIVHVECLKPYKRQELSVQQDGELLREVKRS